MVEAEKTVSEHERVVVIFVIHHKVFIGIDCKKINLMFDCSDRAYVSILDVAQVYRRVFSVVAN